MEIRKYTEKQKEQYNETLYTYPLRFKSFLTHELVDFPKEKSQKTDFEAGGCKKQIIT